MASDFDDDADEAMAVVNGDIPASNEAMIRRLDDILLICATAGLPHEGGGVDVEPAWDYLDRLALTDGLLSRLLVHLRWPIAEHDARQDAERFDAEAAALLGAEPEKAVGRAALPLTCASPEAHLAQVRRAKPPHWLRSIGLLGGGPPPADCPVCWKPLPKSHRRNG